jgi:hypothetical protein
MDENQDSKDGILDELRKIKKRLDSMHSWLAGFIVISVFFFILSIVFSMVR